MTNRKSRIGTIDLTNGLVMSISKELSWYSVGLFRMRDNEVNPTGSGTLVKYGDVWGILTASHVIKELRTAHDIGVLFKEHIHQYKISREAVEFVTIGEPPFGENGPDIGFIKLPRSLIGPLQAEKSFFNLAKCIDFCDNPPDTSIGVWCFQGFPGEMTKGYGPDKNYRLIFQFLGLAMVSAKGPVNSFEQGVFDYIEFEVEFSDERPRNYGGYSGGGLWHVDLEKKGDTPVVVGAKRLMGVVFYEMPPEKEGRRIRCHGPKTVKYLYNKLIHEYKTP